MSAIGYELNGQVGTLTIKSPPANALSSNLLNALSEKLDEIEQESLAKVIILKGDGRFFSAGADIKEFTSLQEASDYQALAEYGQKLFERIEQFSIPVIAAIHGAALGGGMELALACHIRIATENAKLGLPELTLGIIPGFAGTQRLPQHVGTAKAYEMILTGEPISATDAYHFGLVNQLTSEEELDEVALTLATKIAAKSRPAINRVMQLLPYAKTAQFATGVQKEAEAFGEIFGSEDAKEGIQAFLEKRKPNFRDQ
ncbi:enoyl-CoA hydratase [Ornithinibacillus contaminans]|uniref:enoyl-CoA hydratase n=1 Tax=Ornithinibacillus contaminans TaxID=694055 RepID=UPI00064DEE64|nr:enoyl-CoA hydratase [Ornithinibacillus contaminans]